MVNCFYRNKHLITFPLVDVSNFGATRQKILKSKTVELSKWGHIFPLKGELSSSRIEDIHIRNTLNKY